MGQSVNLAACPEGGDGFDLVVDGDELHLKRKDHVMHGVSAYTRKPDKRLVGKMPAMAGTLGARVQGDEASLRRLVQYSRLNGGSAADIAEAITASSTTLIRSDEYSLQG